MLSTSKTELRLLNRRALSLRLKIETELDIRISNGRAFQRGQIRTKNEARKVDVLEERRQRSRPEEPRLVLVDENFTKGERSR